MIEYIPYIAPTAENAQFAAHFPSTLTLGSTSNGNCNQVKDTVIITITNAPVVNAGLNLTKCKNNVTSVLSGTVSGPTTTGIWSGGSGTFNPSTSVLNATYTPSAAELTAGFADLYLTSSSVCRPASGACDVAENCDGLSTSCPIDAFQNTATVCRAAAGACDAVENCTGTSATCPLDVLTCALTPCRASTGVCDLPEVCTGSDANCPTNIF